MKIRLPKVSTLAGVLMLIAMAVVPPVRIFTDRPAFAASDVHFAFVDSDKAYSPAGDFVTHKLHVTAAIKARENTAPPICFVVVLNSINSLLVGAEDNVAGPSIKAGQTWQLAHDIPVLDQDVTKVDHVKIDCIPHP